MMEDLGKMRYVSNFYLLHVFYINMTLSIEEFPDSHINVIYLIYMYVTDEYIIKKKCRNLIIYLLYTVIVFLKSQYFKNKMLIILYAINMYSYKLHLIILYAINM